MLSFFYSVWAHWRIDGERREIVERWYPKRPKKEKKLTPEAWGYLHKSDHTYGTRTAA